MAGPVAMKTVGFSDLILRLKNMGGEKLRSTVGKSLYRRANKIMTDAKTNYVPVDKGPLRASGTVSDPVFDGNTVSVTLSFGDGPSSSYALAVHEHLSEHSPKSWKIAEIKGRHVGALTGWYGTKGPKYLERPFLAGTTGGQLEEDIAADLADRMEP